MPPSGGLMLGRKGTGFAHGVSGRSQCPSVQPLSSTAHISNRGCRRSVESRILHASSSRTSNLIPAAAPAAAPTAVGSSSGSGSEPSQAELAREALALKLAAARELARRLSAEKAAQQQGTEKGQDGGSLRSAEDASVAAAVEAARTDSLARALRKAESSRDALQRLRAENEALRDLLLELAPDQEVIRSKIDAVMATAAAAAPPLADEGAKAEVQSVRPAAGAAPVAVPTPATPAASPAAKAAAAPPSKQKAAAPAAAPGPAPAAAAAIPAPAAPALAPPTLQQLQAAAGTAAASGQAVFTWPSSPVPVGSTVLLYYNRLKGPLPAPQQGQALRLKAGVNKWESIVTLDLERCDGRVNQAGGVAQEWWVARLEVPQETFKMNYVVMETGRQAYDNNGGRDFELPLRGAPSEEQVVHARVQAFQAFDASRERYVEAQEGERWKGVEKEAAEAAAAARVEFRQRRELEHQAAAQAAVAARRTPQLAAQAGPSSVPGVYAWGPGGAGPQAGKRALFCFNRAQGPLAACSSARLHLGYDGWWGSIKQTFDLKPLSAADLATANVQASGGQQWVGAWLEVPHSACVLDWVMSDQEQKVWDNNGSKDFHARVAGAVSSEELVSAMARSMAASAQAKDQEDEERVARAAAKKVYTKGHALRKRRSARAQVLYTVPFTPRAGEKCEVYYNPESTSLRGRPEVHLKASWNRQRWQRDPRSITLAMEPTISGGLGFWKATLDVPKDAWGMDLLFADGPHSFSADAGGFLDSNGGLEYHADVEGAQPQDGSRSTGSPQQQLSVVHVAVEMAPIAKVGGMGDVVTALGRAVQEEGHRVEVILPKYDCINYKQVEGLAQVGNFHHGSVNVRVWKGVVEGLATTFLEPENGYFWVGCVYGRNDDHVRFNFFCQAALQYIRHMPQRPSVVHCHDWPTAPVAYGDRGSARAVFTIHNLSYGVDLVGRAMGGCEVATTVSPTYAREISGHPCIAPHLGKLYGIRNGIDPELWDPESDAALPAPYGPDSVGPGKEAARRALRQRLNLAQLEVPIVSCVTRLVAQKGIHLIKHAAVRALERGAQFVLLGSAPDPKVQAEFNHLKEQLQRQYHDRAALVFTYDEPLSHLIYAGSDMFLVPSMFEPCGLTQMIAMQYGTVPVVRKTGGLADTVFDVDHDEERAKANGLATNGFVFESTDAAGLDYALNRALSTWHSDREGWRRLAGRVMRQDWSWYSPALDYVELYYKAIRGD